MVVAIFVKMHSLSDKIDILFPYKKVGILPIRIVKSNVSSVGSSF